jgi:hypothetical protein
MTEDGGPGTDYYTTICSETIFLALYTLDAGDTFFLRSVVPYEASSASCEIDPGSVSSHFFGAGFVQRGPSG